MQRDGQVHLGKFFPEPPDARHEAAGGKRDVAVAESQPLGIVHRPEEPRDRLIIIEGFAHAHQDDMVDGFAALPHADHDFLQHLPAFEAADAAADGGSAEAAAHVAADLGGDAQGVAVFVGHEHRFHALAVRHAEQEFPGAVGGRLHEIRGSVIPGKPFRQLAAQIFGQIRALVPAFCTPADPGEDLLFPERGKPQFF